MAIVVVIITEILFTQKHDNSVQFICTIYTYNLYVQFICTIYMYNLYSVLIRESKEPN